MANVSLTCHPATPDSRISAVEVEISRNRDASLRLRYAITAQPNVIVVPPLSVAERTAGLWQTTCFELFVRRPASDSYIELNFAPSAQWAAYRFDSYRVGMFDLPIKPPEIVCTEEKGRLTLDVVVELPIELREVALQIGPTAVIKSNDGIMSYWAMRHANPERPDFHHGDCFAFTLPPPSAA